MTEFVFGEFELDSSRRELRLRGRELALQPRVFDLLFFLLQHRDRVVSKDELLETLWPGVIVTEGSLQRAISLARSVLRQGGLTDAIKTHARSGYRFCLEISENQSQKQASEKPELLVQAQLAYDHFEWDNAIKLFQQADRQRALEGPDLERWADATQCAGRPWEAVVPLERAIAAHTSQGDDFGAARSMLNLAAIQFEQRDIIVARGLHQRAMRILPENGITHEHGMLMWLGSRFAAISGELQKAYDFAQQACKIGSEIPDTDIEVLGLNYSGLALQAMGKFIDGAALQDEAAAAVLAGNVSPTVGGIIYCSVIWSCRNRGDWDRAAQWTDHYTRWCKSMYRELTGTCRLHRAEVLSVRGELKEAEREAKDMCEKLSVTAPWAEGDAYQVLGNIYLLRGELENADAAFRRAHELGWDPQPGYALLQVARGDTYAALQTLEISLQDSNWANQQKRGMLLAYLVIVSVSANDITKAEKALAELDAEPELYSTDSMAALVFRARAEFALHGNNYASAVDYFRQSISLWQKVGSQLNIATIRLLLAKLFISQGNKHAAEREIQWAEKCFRENGATNLLSNCEQLKLRL